MKELTYTRCSDYDIPDLELSCREDRPIGKYGRMRKRYLQEHWPVLFNCLLLSERLYPHLLEINEAARRRDRAVESCRPNEMGRDDERIESTDRGNYIVRADLRLRIGRNNHVDL